MSVSTTSHGPHRPQATYLNECVFSSASKMTFTSAATWSKLATLCVFLITVSSAHCDPTLVPAGPIAPSWINVAPVGSITASGDPCAQAGPSVLPVAPIAPIGPLGNHVTSEPIEFIAIGPPPTVDLLAPFGGSLIPNNPSAVEQSIADLVPLEPPTGCTVAHIASFAGPVQVAVNPYVPNIPGSAVEVVEPILTVETSQCGCTLIRLYWIHEVFTLCPLGTGRWAKTNVLGQAELLHEWVLHNTHDIKPNPCAIHLTTPCRL